MRRALALLVLTALAAGFAGCGGNFPLPTESRNKVIPSDKSYQRVATWTEMGGIRDILLTQGAGTQLFLLFNEGQNPADPTASRGRVNAYARLRPDGPQAPIPGIEFQGLFNPVALCAGGDGAGSPANRIYVLDQGDTCLARTNPATGSCDTTGGWSTRITDLDRYWHVRVYRLTGESVAGETFTDTSMASVNGIAADAQGRVYVSGAAIEWVPDVQNPSLKTRSFLWRVKRYLRGGTGDPYMPGADWHRDATWLVRDGSGVGTVADPRGIFWGPYGGGALYTADFGKNWVQKLSDVAPSTGYFELDQAENLSLAGPLDVTADLQGFVYLADAGNQRVLRYDAAGSYVQGVNVEVDASGRLVHPFVDPVTLAADDSLVFVGDAGLAEVIRYKRRP